MNNLLKICVGLTLILSGNGQIIQYASRFRNFSVDSETGSIYLIYSNIFQDKHDHKLSAAVNITKDIHMKKIEVELNRCSYEKSDCENYQRWTFPKNLPLKTIVYMKNQIWTPMFEHVTPKLDIPHIKKNIYQSKDVTIDNTLMVNFYPEVVDYFWRANVFVTDADNRIAAVLRFEFALISFVKRNTTRHRGGTRITKTGN